MKSALGILSLPLLIINEWALGSWRDSTLELFHESYTSPPTTTNFSIKAIPIVSWVSLVVRQTLFWKYSLDRTGRRGNCVKKDLVLLLAQPLFPETEKIRQYSLEIQRTNHFLR